MKRLKQLRKMASLTLDELDQLTGINRTRLCNGENGKVKLSMPEMFLLRSVLLSRIALNQKTEGVEVAEE